jgi:hypothetical protein
MAKPTKLEEDATSEEVGCSHDEQDTGIEEEVHEAYSEKAAGENGEDQGDSGEDEEDNGEDKRESGDEDGESREEEGESGEDDRESGEEEGESGEEEGENGEDNGDNREDEEMSKEEAGRDRRRQLAVNKNRTTSTKHRGNRTLLETRNKLSNSI